MDALVKAAVHLGAGVLLGGGIFARWIAVEPLDPLALRRLRLFIVLGGLLLCVGSLLDVRRAIGDVPLSEFWEYLTLSRHGQSVLVRVGLVGALLVGARPAQQSSGVGRAVYAVAGVLVLGTISVISHTGAHAGSLGVLLDLIHQVAGVVWAGALLYLAALPVWPRGDLRSESLTAALRRISSVGLVSVLAILGTGTFAAVVHLPTLAALTVTAYGRTLTVKLILVTCVIVVAAANRFVLLPRLVHDGSTRAMARTVRIEAMLLVAIFLVTGLLTVQAPPHD